LSKSLLLQFKLKLLSTLKKPRLSLIVIIYKMPAQARKTLYSLSTAYQQGIFAEEYEVIVVENSSSKPMGKEGIEGLKGNFRYFYRDEKLPTPVPAINFGTSLAKGKNIALMIDGARMASPGMIRHILLAHRISKNTVVAVPGYHLGVKVQQEAMSSGYDEEAEDELLKTINWPNNGYSLFDISCNSATSRPGYFRPLGESNCISVSKKMWHELGGIDSRFTETGGGQANLDFYKRVCDLEYVDLILLAGEGTFHQFHGGVTTGTQGSERDKIMQAHFDQYKSIRGEYYTPPLRRPMIFGTIPTPSLRFMDHSVKMAKTKYKLKW
jgi:hypothetical protein